MTKIYRAFKHNFKCNKDNMAARNDLHEDDLNGSDSDYVQYKPKVLKTFKVGIDTVTSMAAVMFKSSVGFYTAICSSSSNELTFCDKDGNIFVHNIQNQMVTNARDIDVLTYNKRNYLFKDHHSSGNDVLVIASYSGVVATTLEKCDKPSYSPAKSPVNYLLSHLSKYVLSLRNITGICGLRNKDGIVACYASEQSYELTPQSRRYVAVYTEPDRYHSATYKSSPSLIIEYKQSADIINTVENSKDRLFTYPKRVTESDIGDLWMVDRKSPNRGDIKVCDIKGNLKFIYSGGPIGSRFDPADVSSNQKNVLVIADCSNHKIHLVGNDGMFIQYLMTEQQGLQLPTAICVDIFQRAWIGCDEGTVHIIRYFPTFEKYQMIHGGD